MSSRVTRTADPSGHRAGRPAEPASGVIDIAIIGAGAAGLMAGIQAGRTLRAAGARGGRGDAPSVVLFDGARTLGAKILVAGGGRCNVTHHAVDESAFAGSTPPAIRRVLGRFTVEQTVAFFADLGVRLKREETGKLFPTTDRARTVLDALLRAARDAGAQIVHPRRVERITPVSPTDPPAVPGARFRITFGDAPDVLARRVILATGGRSLPKSGSDGHGYAIATALGHTIAGPPLPALVPLVVRDGHWIRTLSGIACPVRASAVDGRGRVAASFTDAALLTHFGLSGPAILDVSRFVLHLRREDADARLVIAWLPDADPAEVDAHLRALGRSTVRTWLRARLPERLADALLTDAGATPGTTGASLTRELRRALVDRLTHDVIPVTGDRGWAHAEVTAGGVPLREIELATMHSRIVPGLHLCGEICDVDGRIGGFNFQWAWASGCTAGRGAADALAADVGGRGA